MMAIQIATMGEVHHELLNQVGCVIPAHLMFVQLHQLEEMVQLIQARHVTMGTQIMMMVVVPHVTLNQDILAQTLAQANAL